MVQLLHPYMTTGKIIAFTRWSFVGKVVSLLFNTLSRFVIAFLPRSKSLLIAWLLSPSAVILEPKKKKSLTVSPSICHEVMEPDAMILVFWMLSINPAFSLSSFTFINRPFSFSLVSAIRGCHLHIWSYWYFSQQCWFQLVLHPAQHFSSCTLASLVPQLVKNLPDGDCSHEIKRRLLLARKAMTNLDSILKSETLLCWQRSI